MNKKHLKISKLLYNPRIMPNSAYRRHRIKKIAVLILFFLTALNIPANWFPPGTDLYQTETEHFLLIYSDSTRPQAQRIFSWADEVYREYALLLRASGHAKIPVVITDNSDIANGLTYLSPYTHLVIFTAPASVDSTIGLTRDDLKNTFIHELVHALSLNIRSPFWSFFTPFLGDAITSPNLMYMMPMNFIEGVTVSYESLKGYGRVNDPYIAHTLWQDAREKSFKDPWQSAGAWDLYPGDSLYYYYGGYFSSYLIETYGMEKYTDLWHETGKGNIFLGLSGAVKKIYGKNINRLWKEFYSGFISGPDFQNPPPPIIKGERSISAITGRDDIIYYSDAFTRSLRRLDLSDSRESVILPFDAVDLSLSPSGEKLLITTIEKKGTAYVFLTRIYLTGSRTFMPFRETGLRNSLFIDENKIAAVTLEGEETALKVFDAEGSRVILYGNPEHVLGSIHPWNSEKLLLLSNYKGNRIIGTVALETGRYDPLPLPDLGGLEARIRDVYSEEERILLSVGDGEGFHRLAYFSEETWYYQTTKISGGVFKPRLSGPGVLYTGRFSKGDILFAAELSEFALERIAHKPAFGYETREEREAIAGSLPSERAYRPWEYLLKGYSYPAISYSLPAGDSTSGILNAVDGLGIMHVSQDPAGFNQWGGSLVFNWNRIFPNLDLAWINNRYPLSLSLSVTDEIKRWDTDSPYYRRSWFRGYGLYENRNIPADTLITAFLSGSAYFTSPSPGEDIHPYKWEPDYEDVIFGAGAAYKKGFPSRTQTGFSISAGFEDLSLAGASAEFSGVLIQEFPGCISLAGEAGISLYPWEPNTGLETSLILELGGFLINNSKFYSYEGFRLTGQGLYHPFYGQWLAEALLLFSPPKIPLLLSFYGGYDPEGRFNFIGLNSPEEDPSPFQKNLLYPGHDEYMEIPSASKLVLQGNLDIGIYRLQIQKRLVLPVYLRHISFYTGYRGTYLEGGYYHSANIKIHFELTYLYPSLYKEAFIIPVEIGYAFTTGQFVLPSISFSL